MTIENANDYLLEQGFPEYDVEYSKSGSRHRAYTCQNPAKKPADEVLEETIRLFSPDELYLVPRKKNGSVTRKTAPIAIELGEEYQQPVSGLNGYSVDTPSAPPLQSSGLDTYKDFIIRDLERKLAKAERKVDSQENQLEKLKEVKAELEKNVAFKDKEFELALKEKESDQANSLNGFVSSLKDPETINALAGLAAAVREMRTPQAVEISDSQLPEGIDTEDLEDQYIQQVVLFMSRSTPQVREKVFEIIQKVVTKNQQAA